MLAGLASIALAGSWGPRDAATLVGAHTIGGAAVSFPPWTFELPHSHVLVSLELDMAFNEDGSVNEVHGTMPDVVLEASAFPTTYPASYDVAGLRNDPWIRWVMAQRGRRD